MRDDDPVGASAAQVQVQVTVNERTTFKVQHWPWLAGVALTADGKTLVSGGMERVKVREHRQSDTYNNVLKLWDVATGKERASFPARVGDICPVMTADGTLIVSNDGGDLRVWDAAKGTGIRLLEARRRGVLIMALTPNGECLATGNADCTVTLWDVATGRERLTLDGGVGQSHSLAFSADGKLLASSSGVVKVWDVAKGKELCSFPGHPPGRDTLAFSPNGRTLACGHETDELHSFLVQLHEAKTGRELSTLKGPEAAAGDARLTTLAFTPDGTTLAGGCAVNDEHLIALWGLRGKSEPLILRGHPSSLVTVAFSADGRTMVSASGDGTVKVWDVITTAKDGK
jgi:WD40 repeat protein